MTDKTTALERHIDACHRFYIATRDGRPQAERDALLAEANRLEAEITPDERAVVEARVAQFKEMLGRG